MCGFVCPVCSQPLEDMGSILRCSGNHCFDKSRFGYVNLLMSNQSSAKRHGDDRLMIRARRDFLSAGYYSFLLETLSGLCGKYLPENAVVLDAGCGECYYSDGIRQRHPGYSFLGIDISKDALEFAGKRGVGFPLAVASSYSLPLSDESCDCVINCFSPVAENEFVRVLKKGGVVLSVVPLEEHLFTLKAAVYDKPYTNEKPRLEIAGLEIKEYTEIRRTIHLENRDDVSALFRMTPYYYKTSREDQAKLDGIDNFDTCAAFGIFVFGKEE